MRLLAAWLVTLAGCDRVFGLSDLVAPPPDADLASIDADLGMLIDAGPCTAKVYGRFGMGARPGLFSICADVGIGTVALMGPINTDSDPRCDVVKQDTTNSSDVCVFVASTIMINLPTEVHGQRPLVLVAETISISSTLDVSSQQGPNTGAPGAGANWPGCGIAVNGKYGIYGGGGGAGGSFGTQGGNGGPSSSGEVVAAKNMASPDRVRGGCAGGNGGASAASVAGGAGGASGGAVYLIAGTMLQLSGSAVINASGAGGSGGITYGDGASTNNGGGGGGAGGSGGLIGLDARMITITTTSKLIANGGGGGGGGGNILDGNPGADPSPATPHTAAQGGENVFLGGGGGNGATTAAGGSGQPSNAGGGGGGGGGAIRVFTPLAPGMPTNVSPPWRVNE